MSTEGEEDSATGRTGPPPRVPRDAGPGDGAGGVPSESPADRGGGAPMGNNGRPRADSADESAEDPDRTLPLDAAPPVGGDVRAASVLASIRSPSPADGETSSILSCEYSSIVRVRELPLY